MFALSLGKLLELAILILIVWYGFKYATRIQQVRQAARAEAQRRRDGGAARVQQSARPVEDLVKCRQCGSFVAAQGTANCGKPGCPWGG